MATERLDQLAGTTTEQLSNVEDADVAQTYIDFSTQQAAYQAALKAGATIVQASLMDFLH
jgi:flagellar hook-associated protein 3 FlgL